MKEGFVSLEYEDLTQENSRLRRELQAECDAHELAKAELAGLLKKVAAISQNYQDGWTALRMVRDAIEELGGVGVLPSAKAVMATLGPEPTHEARALVEGIRRLVQGVPWQPDSQPTDPAEIAFRPGWPPREDVEAWSGDVDGCMRVWQKKDEAGFISETALELRIVDDELRGWWIFDGPPCKTSPWGWPCEATTRTSFRPAIIDPLDNRLAPQPWPTRLPSGEQCTAMTDQTAQ